MLVKCQICNKEFKIKPSKILKGFGKYCSSKCAHIAKQKPSKINIFEDYAEIVINTKKYGEIFSKIDLDDVEKVKNFCWRIRKNKNKLYVETSRVINHKQQHIHLHRLIMSTPKDLVVDHINGDSLDNRKINLRNISQKVNTYNRSKCNSSTGYVGIYKANNKYFAKAGNKYLGSFLTIYEAINARNNYIKINNLGL